MVAGIVSSLGAPLIPAVARSLHTSLTDAQWSLTAALLVAAVLAPIMGRLGDGRYQRETLLAGLGIVFLGSLIAGGATSLPVLILGRGFQGFGLGLAPVTMAAARTHLPLRRSREVIAVLSVSGAAAVGAGYPISGLIAEAAGIHAAFLFGAVMSGAALLAALRAIPSNRAADHVEVDVKGAIVASAGMVALLLAIGQGHHWGWSSATTLGLFATAVIVLGAFVQLELRAAVPLVDLRQLRHRAVLVANLAAAVLGVALYMFLTVITEFMQEPHSGRYGFSASTLLAGLALVPFSVVSLAASRTTIALMRRTGASPVLIAGSLAIAASGAFFAILHRSLWEAFAAMAGIGLGFGYTFAAIPGLITRAVASRDTGSAMGLYQVIRYVGFAIGSALSAQILAGYTPAGSARPDESGFVLALWIGSAICLASAIVSWSLARGPRPEPGGRDLEATLRAEAELTTAGLVGVESIEPQ
jgi:MFS family permease